MSDDQPTTPTTVSPSPEGASPETPKPTDAPKSTPEFTAEQKTWISETIADRVRRAQEKAEQKVRTDADAAATKTADERIAQLEAQFSEQLKASEQTAVRSIIARGVAGTHNPAVAASIVLGQLGELGAGDEEAILAKCADVLTENPYLVKAGTATDTPAPVANLTPAPGAAQSEADKTFLPASELESTTTEQLARDPELRKRYLASLDA